MAEKESAEQGAGATETLEAGDFSSLLEKEFKCPVFILNDVDASGLDDVHAIAHLPFANDLLAVMVDLAQCRGRHRRLLFSFLQFQRQHSERKVPHQPGEEYRIEPAHEDLLVGSAPREHVPDDRAHDRLAVPVLFGGDHPQHRAPGRAPGLDHAGEEEDPLADLVVALGDYSDGEIERLVYLTEGRNIHETSPAPSRLFHLSTLGTRARVLTLGSCKLWEQGTQVDRCTPLPPGEAVEEFRRQLQWLLHNAQG